MTSADRRRPLGMVTATTSPGFVLVQLDVSIVNVAPARIDQALHAAEARGRAPMLPLGLFRDATFSAAPLAGLGVNFVLYGTIFVLSLYFQRVRGYTPAATGRAFLPFMASLIVANVAGGRTAAPPAWRGAPAAPARLRHHRSTRAAHPEKRSGWAWDIA